MNFALPAMVKINTTDITDESRGPVSVSLDERSSENILASGRKTKYIKYKARNFSISWDNIPNSSALTVDGKAGRSELIALLFGDDEFTLTLSDGINSPQVYTVFLSNYSEEPTLRRQGHMRWSVKVDFTEVGG